MPTHDLRIAQDIDGCLANFIQHFLTTARSDGHTEFPVHWTQWEDWMPPGLDDLFGTVFSEIAEDDEWWLSIPPYDDAYLPYEPDAYVTSRPVSSEVSEAWLQENGFPEAPVHTVGPGQSKTEVLDQENIDLMVEDSTSNFEEINSTRHTTCVLLSRSWNLDVPTERGIYRMNGGRWPLDLRVHYLSEVPIWAEEYGELILS
jgi:hypothetical protein